MKHMFKNKLASTNPSQRCVFVKLWIDDDEVDAAEPKREEVIAEGSDVAIDCIRGRGVALDNRKIMNLAII